MTSLRWLVFSFFACLAACSNDAGDDVCSTSNVVDDDDFVSTSQSLSASEQRGIARVIDALFGLPDRDVGARTRADAPRSAAPNMR